MALIPLVWYCQSERLNCAGYPGPFVNTNRMIIYVRKYVISDLHLSLHRIYLQWTMQDTLTTPLQSMEYTDRHPILSFISALFWVLRRSSSLLNVKEC
jgi:hypothetical protein